MISHLQNNILLLNKRRFYLGKNIINLHGLCFKLYSLKKTISFNIFYNSLDKRTFDLIYSIIATFKFSFF